MRETMISSEAAANVVGLGTPLGQQLGAATSCTATPTPCPGVSGSRELQEVLAAQGLGGQQTPSQARPEGLGSHVLPASLEQSERVGR